MVTEIEKARSHFVISQVTGDTLSLLCSLYFEPNILVLVRAENAQEEES